MSLRGLLVVRPGGVRKRVRCEVYRRQGETGLFPKLEASRDKTVMRKPNP